MGLSTSVTSVACIAGGLVDSSAMSVWVLYWILAEERQRKSKKAMWAGGDFEGEVFPLQNLPAPLPFVATLRRPPAMMSKTIRTLPIRYVHVYHTDTVLPKPELLRATIEFLKRKFYKSPIFWYRWRPH